METINGRAEAGRVATLPTSEVFYSLEGEGLLTGTPTVFIRTFGCNLSCPGFSNPSGKAVEYDGTQKAFRTGCDSAYAWHKSFAGNIKRMSSTELRQAVLDCAVSKRFPKALSLTGGEPMLQQLFFGRWLLEHIDLDFNYLLIETNATVPATQMFIDALNGWCAAKDSRVVYWSNSPKLSISGEQWEDTIVPSVIARQSLVDNSFACLKFVSDGTDESFDEIARAVNEYEQACPEISAEHVRVMPVGSSRLQQQEVQTRVAEQCLLHGYNFSTRLHCHLWDDQIGK